MDRCSSGAVVRRSLMIATLLLIVGTHEVAAQVAFVLQPKTYRAPSGRYELSVDPSDLGDADTAKYRLQENGKDRWSVTLPFALIEAAVTDNGTTIGYGYTGDRNGRCREFVVAILDAAGKVRLKDLVKRGPSPFVDSDGSLPSGIGVVVDELNDRLIIRVASAQWRQLETWWIYRLSSARAVGKQDLSKLWQDSEPYRRVFAIRPIQGTPLTLVHFVRNTAHIPRGTHGATFGLLDLPGRLVWSLELPFDYMASDRETGEKLSQLLVEGRYILRSDKPRAFDLFFAAASQRVSYSVTPSASGQWTVKETARAPFALIPAPKQTLMMLPKRALKPLEPLVLRMHRSGAPSPIQQTDELVAVSSIAIDPQGRLYPIDRKTGAMYVFDSSGRFLHICRATLKDFSGLVPDPAISFGDQGDVYLGPGEGIEGLSRRCPYAHFDANGKRLDSVVWIGFSSWLQPRTNHLIELSFAFAALNELSGQMLRELGLRPDGHRLSGVESACVATDGSFAILANQYEKGGETINVFTADGDPIGTIPLRGLMGVIEMAYDGQRIAVAAEQGLFFFDRSGTALYRCDSPVPPLRDSVQVPYFLDVGRTLALFDGRNPVLYRYQLP
jgi:hypothetical protein